VLQELEAVEDEPGQKLLIELRTRALPPPLGQPVLGKKETVEEFSAESARAFHGAHYRPNGAILGVAGAVDFQAVCDAVGRLFEDWKPAPEPSISIGAIPGGPVHLPGDKIQTHIGVAYPSVRYDDPDFFNAHGAVGVLSGGMSARLFTEVREKRGLCYSVSASFHPLKDRGLIMCYAGTTNERANETLAVLLGELKGLQEGVKPEEVARVRTGLKASLIMQEESTAARASVLARSWYHLGRVRAMEEVAREIDRLTPDSILGYLRRHPAKDFVIVTLGPQALEIAK
jgi:predicted Zn-dependent peptidase